MIIYNESWFGLVMLTRLRGSAVAKALSLTVLSTATMIAFYYGNPYPLDDYETVEHPYAIGVMMAAFTFLLTFRANFAYNRYWEACQQVHAMHSKWIDCGVNIAAFHLQSSLYEKIRPLSFGAEGKNGALKNKRRYRVMTKQNEKHSDNRAELSTSSIYGETKKTSRFLQKFFFRTSKKKNDKLSTNDPNNSSRRAPRTPKPAKYPSAQPRFEFKTKSQSFRRRVDTNSDYDDDDQSEKFDNIEFETRLDGGIDDDLSSLFLQEFTHLLSLLSAIALSSLRHDMEFAETPLATFEHEASWPPVDPDHINAKVKRTHLEESTFSTIMMYIFGYSRSTYHRTVYNSSRPFKVIGGVSDAEAKLLKEALGPLAKVTLVLFWLQEFVTRESMNGSTGGVAPPIISRIHQSTTDGFDAYNQARKIAYTPFPFPHAQITTYYVVVACVILPMFMLSYASNIYMAIFLNFFSLLCFTGLHEVARELEAPFRNAPNDIPLNNFQAQFNEALVCLNAGFHPDSFWTHPVQSSDTVQSNETVQSSDPDPKMEPIEEAPEPQILDEIIET